MHLTIYMAIFLIELADKEAEYLRGNSSTDECADLFKKYNFCLTVGYLAHLVQLLSSQCHPRFVGADR